MIGIFQIALSNAALATAAAPLVWSIGKLAKRPALTHALWVVVLLKLITPPIWSVPVALPQTMQRIHAPAKTVGETTANSTPSASSPVPADHVDVEAQSLSVTDAVEAPAVEAVPVRASRSAVISELWPPAVETVWVMGSILCLGVAVIRMVRFSRALRHAIPAPPQVQQQVERLARRLSMNRTPAVWFIPGALCPMLWAVGHPARLLIPAALWNRLDSVQRDAIVVHELAHWRRRDHWVRWIELLATSLYWWLPICWWARRELREAEEQCCDAWVLWVTGDFRFYANALLEAVEFVSIRTDLRFRPIAVPALASGMGQFGHLKRRFIMLKNGNVARALSWGGIAAAFGLGAVLLPIAPTVAQENSKIEQRIETVKAEGPERISSEASAEQRPAAQKNVIGDDTDSDRELQTAKREVAALRRKLEEAEARISLLQRRDEVTAIGEKPANDATIVQRKDGRFDVVVTDPDTGRIKSVQTMPDKASPVPGVKDGMYRTAIIDPATGRIKEIQVRPLKEPKEQMELGSRDEKGSPQTERLDKIESQLRDLLHQIETIRAQAAGTKDVEPRKF